MSKLDEMGATDEALGDIHALAISLEVARQSELAMILAAAHEKIQTSLIALIERVESQQQVIDGYARDWHSLSSAAKEKQQEIDRLKAENEKLREMVKKMRGGFDMHPVTCCCLYCNLAAEAREVLGE